MNSLPESLHDLLIAALAALALALRELVPFLKRRWIQRRVLDIKGGWHGINSLNQALHTLRRRTGAMRVAVVKLNNGGGIPRPGNPVYSSVIYESVEDDTEGLLPRWQNQPVDGAYSQIAANVCVAGATPTFVETASMEQCSLRYMYEADGVAGAVKYLLGHSPHNWTMYVSVQFGKEDLGANGKLALTPQQLDRLREGVLRLREIVRAYNEVLL